MLFKQQKSWFFCLCCCPAHCIRALAFLLPPELAGWISLHHSISFFTPGSLLYCVHLILRCHYVKPLNSFSILVAQAFRHYLSSDLYLTYKRCNFYFRGEKILSFISPANIQHQVWRTNNHTCLFIASYYKQEGIWSTNTQNSHGICLNADQLFLILLFIGV